MKAVLQWVLRTMMKDQTGIVQTMPKKDIVEMNTQITAQRLMQNGIDPTQLKNANQVENAINMIEKRPNVQEGITAAKSADVFELQMPPKKINPKKGIMGGKQIPDDDLPPPGSRGGKDDIAAPVQSSEETIKNMIEAENKKNISKMKNRKMVDDAIDNASPGFVKGDRKYNAQLVAEDLANKKFGKDFYDLDQKQQMDLYGEALDELTDLDKFAQGGRAGFKDGMLKKGLKAITGTDTYKTLEDRGFNAAVLMSEGFDQIYNLLSGMPGLAEGGRIGYKDGPEKPGRRTFMKAAAGLASLLPFGLGKVGKVAAPVVTKAAEITGPALAKLVETVMSLGKTLSMKGRKLKELTTKKKYKDIEVEEDMLDGPSYTIKKGNKEIYYKPGRMDETGGIEDDIIEIIDKTIKKAGGGIARMLGE